VQHLTRFLLAKDQEQCDKLFGIANKFRLCGVIYWDDKGRIPEPWLMAF
jgi:hypothetical protein